MSEQLTADVLFTLRAVGIALACAWAARRCRPVLRVRFTWPLVGVVLATGAVVIGGYSVWRWWQS